MPSVAAKIASHNKKLLNREKVKEAETTKTCNCRKSNDCPLDGSCLSESVVYKATVQDEQGGIETYIGLTEGSFKDRFTSHKSSFKLPSKATSTTLSGHIWQLKNSSIEYSITWEILYSAPAYHPAIGRCLLCLKEKQAILYSGGTLNSRSEISNTCRHKKKYSLAKS